MKKRLLRTLALTLILAVGTCCLPHVVAQSDPAATQRASAAKRLARDLGAATTERTVEELLENFFRDNDGASESDAQMFLENLEAYRAHPLDLNRASAQDLQELRLLSDMQIEHFLDYRARFGPFLNAYELQAIPNWEVDDIRMLLLFGRVQTGLEQRQTRLIRGFAEGQNQLLLRAGRFDPATYAVFGADAELSKANVEGGPYAFGVRYRHNFDNRLRFGFTADNDAGEAFARKSNPQGFDFYSAHLFAQQLNRTVQAVALGDYTARFGQGLLLQMGFAANKSAESVSVTRSGRKLNAYAAFGEVRFFRGAATTLAFGKRWEMTALYSNRRRDANIDTLETDTAEEAFTSLQTSGLHRSPTEIADERALHERVGGLSLSRLWRNGHITANGLSIRYDKPWQPQNTGYRLYTFRGQHLDAASVDYRWQHHNWQLFGEAARSGNGGLAFVNGLLVTPDAHATLALLHRSLGPDYQSIYGNPFNEISGASNERGLYLGGELRYIRRWKINFYADLWKHPWLRSGISGPSHGREYLTQVHWMQSKAFSVYALWRSETKQRDSDAGGLVENHLQRWRIHAAYKVGTGVEMRSRIEWTSAQEEGAAPTYGFLAYQEAVVKPFNSPLSGAVRYALFDTESFDTRVFVFENDLFTALSIPALSGRGSRFYCNLQWRISRWLRLEGRVEQTYRVRSATSTGFVGKRTGYKLQMQIRW